MTKPASIFQTFRPPFLILTPICLFLASALAVYQGYNVSITPLLIMLVTALLAHIAVNTLNEYHDFKSGLDLATNKTPFSGGSGTLPARPELANATLYIGACNLIIITLLGLYLASITTFSIVPFGIVGVLIVITYTKWLNRMPLLCLISPGVGFSLIMVVGSYLALTRTMDTSVWLIAIIPFLQINNLLLLNQYPDVKADSESGRITFPIKFGEQASNLIYAAFAIAPFITLVALIFTNILPTLSYIALIGLVPALVAVSGAFKLGFNIGSEPKFLAANVACSLLTPLFLAISLVL